jgi:hypothetical protein
VTKVAGALGLRVSFPPAKARRVKSKRVPSAKQRLAAKPAKGGKRIAKKQAKAAGEPNAAKRRKAA